MTSTSAPGHWGAHVVVVTVVVVVVVLVVIVVVVAVVVVVVDVLVLDTVDVDAKHPWQQVAKTWTSVAAQRWREHGKGPHTQEAG